MLLFSEVIRRREAGERVDAIGRCDRLIRAFFAFFGRLAAVTCEADVP